jgi:hypothetical protein
MTALTERSRPSARVSRRRRWLWSRQRWPFTVAALVLLAMAVPVNVGGWGPREGVAAWAFAVAGSSAATGVAAATVYGVLVIAASLPGVAVLLHPRRQPLAPPEERVRLGSGCG